MLLSGSGDFVVFDDTHLSHNSFAEREMLISVCYNKRTNILDKWSMNKEQLEDLAAVAHEALSVIEQNKVPKKEIANEDPTNGSDHTERSGHQPIEL